MTDGSGTGAALEGADDAFLVARAVDGDLRAFAALLTRHQGTLRHYVDRLTRNAADTDDVLQETAITAWRRLDSLSDPAKVRSWLIRTATRQALDAIARRRGDVELEDDSAVTPGPDLGVDAIDLRQRLQATLDALPQQQARCWVLRELGGYSYREIADRLALPESTVRGSLAQARKTILASMGGGR